LRPCGTGGPSEGKGRRYYSRCEGTSLVSLWEPIEGERIAYYCLTPLVSRLAATAMTHAERRTWPSPVPTVSASEAREKHVFHMTLASRGLAKADTVTSEVPVFSLIRQAAFIGG
jgi:hypothetical protein